MAPGRDATAHRSSNGGAGWFLAGIFAAVVFAIGYLTYSGVLHGNEQVDVQVDIPELLMPKSK